MSLDLRQIAEDNGAIEVPSREDDPKYTPKLLEIEKKAKLHASAKRLKRYRLELYRMSNHRMSVLQYNWKQQLLGHINLLLSQIEMLRMQRRY